MSARILAALAVAAYAAFGARGFLGDGLPIAFDAHSHVARTWMAAQALAEGHYPTWSNAWYTGFRVLEFYSPGYHLLTGALSLLVGDVVETTRWVVWAGQVASIVAFFAFARRAIGDPWAAGLAAVLFVASPVRTTVLGTVGNYPTLLVYLAAAGVLWNVCRPASERDLPRLAAAQALLLGGSCIAHLSNTLALLPALLAFEVAWLWPAGLRRVLPMLAASLAGAFALAGFVIEPLVVDLRLVSLSLETTRPELGVDALLRSLGRLPYRTTHAFGQALPVGYWLAGTLAALVSLHPTLRRARPLAAGLATSLLALLFFGERAAPGLELFLVALCGAALDGVARGVARGVASTSGPGPALGLRALALAGAIAWAGWLPGGAPRYEPADSLAAYTRLPTTRFPSRTFDVTSTTIALDGLYGWSSFSPCFSGRSIPFGGFPQAAPRSTNVSAALAGIAAAELRSDPPRLSDDAADLFYLLHVELLIDRGTPELLRRTRLEVELHPVLPRLRADPALGTRTGPELFRLRHASPAIFAPRLEVPPRRPQHLLEERWRTHPSDLHPFRALDVLFRVADGADGAALLPFLRGLDLDRARATASRLWVEGLEPGALPEPAAGAPQPGRFEVLAHRERPARVEIEARAERAGWVRVSYAFDPALEFRLDGEPVPALADALGSGSVVRFPAGTHTVSLERRPDRTRAALGALSLGLAAGLGVYLLRRRDARQDGGSKGHGDSLKQSSATQEPNVR